MLTYHIQRLAQYRSIHFKTRWPLKRRGKNTSPSSLWQYTHTTYSRLCSPLLYPAYLVSVSLRISTPVRVTDREADAFSSFLLLSSVQMKIRSIDDTSTFPWVLPFVPGPILLFWFRPLRVSALFLLPALLYVPRLVRSLGLHPPIATLSACIFDFTPYLSCHHFVPTKRMVESLLFFYLFFHGL